MPSTAIGVERRSAEQTWLIEELCPQCGGAVLLEETDRLLRCPYCRVQLVLAGECPTRYLLPPKRTQAGHFFVPYWRLKGLCFDLVSCEVRHSLVDQTVLACAIPGLPPTLGIRPQAMRLRLARPQPDALYLRTEISRAEALTECRRLIRDIEEEQVITQFFLGTRVTVIYLPIAIGDGIYDGVLDRRIVTLPPGGLDLGSRVETAAVSEIRFLPALCPNCAGDLEGEKDSLVLLCRTCSSAWRTDGERLVPINYATVFTGWKASAYLPFWRLRLHIDGCSLANYADLVRFANLPMVARPEQRPLLFWLPAFKLEPHHFLRLSRALTVTQPDDRATRTVPGLPPYPVTLPLEDAVSAISVLLADLARPKAPFYEIVAGARVHVEESTLTYLPFAGDGRELTHPRLPVYFSRQLLAYGRGL